MTPSPAALPYAKLEWLNGVYIRDMDPEELQERLHPLPERGVGHRCGDAATAIARLAS